jgi:SAM-dependent methyltransferase
MANDFTTTEEVLGVYRKRARRYDLTANIYCFLGFREWACRKRAIEALGLQRGDTVVEIGCGTGLNFGVLEERIGPAGRPIGVDLTDAMLSRARARVEASGWRKVKLLESPAASFRFPPEVDGILSTLALTLAAATAGGRVRGLQSGLPSRISAAGRQHQRRGAPHPTGDAPVVVLTRNTTDFGALQQLVPDGRASSCRV